jgi:hypothetical protein
MCLVLPFDRRAMPVVVAGLWPTCSCRKIRATTNPHVASHKSFPVHQVCGVVVVVVYASALVGIVFAIVFTVVFLGWTNGPLATANPTDPARNERRSEAQPIGLGTIDPSAIERLRRAIFANRMDWVG